MSSAKFSRWAAVLKSAIMNAIPSADELRNALKRVIDPEVGMNIVDLGLVYRIETAAGSVSVDMTMTSPACPMGDMILDEVRIVLQALLPKGTDLAVNLVWSPPWDPSMMTDDAKQHFGW